MFVLLSRIQRFGECIRYSDGHASQLDSTSDTFAVMFALSWTTFSTVGYGNAWPALEGGDQPANEPCFLINAVLIIEAFVGVAFAGSCGALVLIQVSHISDKARVTFSEIITVQFGSGIIDESDSDSDDGHADTTGKIFEKNITVHPCPMLEFRILNDMHTISQGVITNATIECAASIKEDRHENAQLECADCRDQYGRVMLPRIIFCKCFIMNCVHPFFKRCWTAMHLLDENSPLITEKTRKIILQNGGLWPHSLSNAKDIHKCLVFEDIVISFNGVSKHTATNVTAQKVYNRDDVVIGYKFVNILEKHDGIVKVQIDSLNDVMKQDGHDEPLPFNFDENLEQMNSEQAIMESSEVSPSPTVDSPSFERNQCWSRLAVN